VVWLWQQRRGAAERAVGGGMSEARGLRGQGLGGALGGGGELRAGHAAAREGGGVGGGGGGAASGREGAEGRGGARAGAAGGREWGGGVEGEGGGGEADRGLLGALLEVRGPREGPRYRTDEKGSLAELTEPSADEQFAAAFRAWGLKVNQTPIPEAARRLGA